MYISRTPKVVIFSVFFIFYLSILYTTLRTRKDTINIEIKVTRVNKTGLDTDVIDSIPIHASSRNKKDKIG